MASRTQWFGRCRTRHGALTPLGVNAEFVFVAAETFCERAGRKWWQHRSNASRIRGRSRTPGTRTDRDRRRSSSSRPLFANDVGRDLPGEASDARDESGRCPAWMQRKVGEPRYDEACKELRIFEAGVTERTLRASGSNPKFRMT